MHQTQFSEKIPYGGFSQIRSQNTPEGTTGVQISLKEKFLEKLEHLIQTAANDAEFLSLGAIRVKVTGDGTWIGK